MLSSDFHSALGIQRGGIVGEGWVVDDVSYSETFVYAHCFRKRTKRGQWEHRIFQYRPFDMIKYRQPGEHNVNPV